MLQSITWSQYFLFMVVLTLLYYAFVWAVYFKASLSLLQSVISPRKIRFNESAGEQQKQVSVDVIIENLRPLFRNQPQPHSLVKALKQELSKYSFRDDPELRKTITQFIITESEQQCSIRLVEDDLGVVW